MGGGEIAKRVNELKKGDIIRARLGSSIIGFDEVELVYDGPDEKPGYINANMIIKKSRFNPKGRIDHYWLPFNRLLLE